MTKGLLRQSLIRRSHRRAASMRSSFSLLCTNTYPASPPQQGQALGGQAHFCLGLQAMLLDR